MAVAKSYQSLEIIKEPYSVDNKTYVQVKMKNGNIKQIRWYTDKQYEKLYNEPVDHSNDPFWKSQKEVLGFKNGYITIFKGNTYEHKDWFKENGARYTRHWGWGFSSEMELPSLIPEGVEAVRLDWDLVGEGENLKGELAVKAAIESLISEPVSSEYQGNIGDRLTLDLTVKKTIHLDGFYGPSTMHIMEDAEGNVFVWTTSAKSWSVDTQHLLRGTIKEHKIYKNCPQTILTRCKEVTK